MAAKAEKDPKTGKWLIQYRYTDWQGNRKKSMKRGFKTKREAEEWLQNFLATKQADFNMLFEDFLKIYYADMETRLREHTMRTKKYVFDLKILPYFGKMKMNEITASDIRKWQSELIKQGYAPTYLKTISNQLAALFNYAVRYYDLPNNPCRKAGSMGKGKADEMNFWTKEEFDKFIDRGDRSKHKGQSFRHGICCAKTRLPVDDGECSAAGLCKVRKRRAVGQPYEPSGAPGQYGDGRYQNRGSG